MARSDERQADLNSEPQQNQINAVKKIANIDFIERTSNLINDKGAPVLNQVTPFRNAKSQIQWEIKSRKAGNDDIKNVCAQQSRVSQNVVLQQIQKIEESNQMIEFREQDFERNFIRQQEISIKNKMSAEHEQKVRNLIQQKLENDKGNMLNKMIDSKENKKND